MPGRLALRLIVSLTIIVIIVKGISNQINVKTQERQLLNAMILGADQLSKGITSATWHAMLADRRENAYQVMQTIALKQGIDRIQIFNKEGRIMFSTRPAEINTQVDKKAEACSLCHASLQPLVKVDVPSRARIFRGPDLLRKLAMITPIQNEPSCSQAECHAHPEAVKVLGILDVVLDFDPVDREVANIQYRAMLSTGISVILVGLFIVFFIRHFVDIPIRKLIEGTRAVSTMQLDKPIEVKAGGELGELARSFNFMREQLKDAMDEIDRFTQRLESKVTERTEQLKTAHQMLLQSDRLASLGQLSASVAHEINNPLSGVLNLSMLMQRILRDDGIPPDRVSEFRKCLSQVVHETSRVGRIVSDLLAFSRRSKPQKAPADLNGIIGMTLSVVSHKLKLANIEVRTARDERLPELFCDRSQMQQVVMNLLLNAAEAIHDRMDGQVFIRTGLNPSGEA